MLSREYENMNTMSFKKIKLYIYIYKEFKQHSWWYEIITYDSKQIQILLMTLEIGVQRFRVLPARVSNCYLI